MLINVRTIALILPDRKRCNSGGRVEIKREWTRVNRGNGDGKSGSRSWLGKGATPSAKGRVNRVKRMRKEGMRSGR